MKITTTNRNQYTQKRFMMKTIKYIAPEFRNHPDAQQFANILGNYLSHEPEYYGTGCAWYWEIPTPEKMRDAAEALAAELYAEQLINSD